MKQLESLVVMLLCTFGAITQANATTIQTDSIESKRSQIDVASDQEHRTKKINQISIRARVGHSNKIHMARNGNDD